MHFKKKYQTVRNVVFLLSFCCLLVALFGPYGYGRGIVIVSIKRLMKMQIALNIRGLCDIAEITLTKYTRHSQYMALLANYSIYMSCDKKGIFNFTKFAKYSHQYTSPQPSSLYLAIKESYCEIIYNTSNSDDFLFYYLFYDPDSNMTIIRIYDNTVDFSSADWDPKTTGTRVNEIDPFLVLDDTHSNFNSTIWMNYYTSNDKQYRYQMSAISPILNEDGTTKLLTGMSLDVTVFEELFKMEKINAKTYYAFIDTNGGVIFDSIHGAQSPKYLLPPSLPVYPALFELNDTFWKNVYEIAKRTGFEDISDFRFNETLYFVTLGAVRINHEITHYMVMVVDISDMFIRAFYSTTSIFIIVLFILFSIFVIVQYLNRKNIIRKEQKLNRQQIFNDGYRAYTGSIGKVINKLRELQLTLPEEIMLNKILDNSVTQLAQTKSRHFAVSTHTNCDCDFCRSIVLPPISLVSDMESNKKSFIAWKNISMPLCSGIETPLRMDWDVFEADPSKELVNLMIKIIYSNNLLFPEFDPDGLINFFYSFTPKLKNPVHCGHVIITLFNMLNGPFKNWILSRIDLLAIYFVAFIKDMKPISPAELTFLLPKDTDDKEVYKYAEVFINDYSVTQRNMKYILHFLHEYIPKPENPDPITDYFENIVLDILFSIIKENQCEIFGELNIRIESPEFSVHSDNNDKILFLKALLKWCDYCQYWEPEETRSKAFEFWNNSIFNADEMKDLYFVSKFHYSYAKEMVTPWVKIFSNFASFETLQKNLDKTISYWENQIDEHAHVAYQNF